MVVNFRPDHPGVCRRFWEPAYFGGKQIALAGLPPPVIVRAPDIRQALTNFTRNENFSGMDQQSTDFLVTERAKCKIFAKGEQLEGEDELKSVDKLMQLCLSNALQDGTYTAHKFGESLKLNGDIAGFTLYIRNIAAFQKMLVNLAIHEHPPPQVPITCDPVITLKLFAETNPVSSIERGAMMAFMRKNPELMDTVTKFIQTSVVIRAQKERALWLYGAPNSGKTGFADCLNTIFRACQLEGEDFADVDGVTDGQVQLVVLDEVSLKFFFGSKVSQTKRMFEGRGFLFNKKFEKQTKLFVGAGVLVCSNGLPAMSKLLEDGTRNMDWTAIQTRCKFVHFQVSHPGGRFPYSAPQLADYMLNEIQLGAPLVLPQAQPMERKRVRVPRIDQGPDARYLQEQWRTMKADDFRLQWGKPKTISSSQPLFDFSVEATIDMHAGTVDPLEEESLTESEASNSDH